jgi:hypothetical protein
MAKNRKQHFVPKFYMKRFSMDGRSVGLINIPTGRVVQEANLKNQSYRPYFYGKEDLGPEEILGELETAAANLLRYIDTFEHEFKLPPPDYFLLLFFTIVQYGRTGSSSDRIEAYNEKMLKHQMKGRLEEKGIGPEDFRIRMKGAARLSTGITAEIAPLIMDLKCALLLNSTSIEFVTSDNPVVPYNQLMEFQKGGSNTGWAVKGLQVYFPIGPRRALLLYDPAVYKVQSNSGGVVKISSEKDVNELNTLQVCSAQENIYFRSLGLSPKELLRKAKLYLRKETHSFSVFPGEQKGNQKSELVAYSQQDVATNLSLTFVKIQREAKAWRAGFRKLKSKPVTVVRDQEACEAHEDFLVSVRAGEYGLFDFQEYLRDKVRA